MADQNTDGTKPISSGIQPGVGEHLLDNASYTAGSASSASTSGTGTATGGTADSSAGARASGMAGKAVETVKESGARIADEARHYAGDMANLAKEKSRSVFQQQKEAAVGQVDSVAHAFRSTADQLQGEGQAMGRYLGMAADQLESFGSRIRNKDLDTLIDDTQQLARRAPTAFFAGTVVAGFLLARFMKSSSDRRRSSADESADLSRDEWRTSSAADTDTFSSRPASQGVAGAGLGDASGSSGIDSERNYGGRTTSSMSDDRSELDAGGTPGAAPGAAGTGTAPSGLTGSTTGGNTHGNR